MPQQLVMTSTAQRLSRAQPFEWCIGIDYSGAGAPDQRQPGLQVYRARPGGSAPELLVPDGAPSRRRTRWSRNALTDALIAHLSTAGPTIIAIDHALGFPLSYLERYGLATWPTFLADFVAHWPTTTHAVEAFRAGNPRSGKASEYRLCERWTSGAKSVFQFDVQGSVAKSTHAGLPQLARLRAALGNQLHVWPFDGFTPQPGQHLIAETFPSLFRRRYPCDNRTADEQDAWAVARWLSERCARDELGMYLHPPLDAAEGARARLEGWILGVV